MIPPTLQECEFLAEKIGLPKIEAQKFFYHYESNGWKVGKVPLVSLRGAMSGWKIRWEEKHQPNQPDYRRGI